MQDVSVIDDLIVMLESIQIAENEPKGRGRVERFESNNVDLHQVLVRRSICLLQGVRAQ